MASKYSYGKKKYVLPPGPRGDTPGSSNSQNYGNRTTDMRGSGMWNANVRRYPSAPFGRFEDGSPIPENMSRNASPGYAPRAKVKRKGDPNAWMPPSRRNPATGNGVTPAFRKQKGWNS